MFHFANRKSGVALLVLGAICCSYNPITQSPNMAKQIIIILQWKDKFHQD